jgi:hypothetical protein
MSGIGELRVRELIEAVHLGKVDPDALVWIRDRGNSDPQAKWQAGGFTIVDEEQLLIEP